MRIIKEGAIPEKEWKMECPRCRCVFAFDDRDVRLYLRHDGNEWVHCPTCNKAIHCEDRKYWE
jgi:uncharacterized C2H2 Zn-finger protein